MLTKYERKKNRMDEVKDKKKEGMRKDFFFLENIKQKDKDKKRDFFFYVYIFLKKVRLGS
jgi:hypothetical protein